MGQLQENGRFALIAFLVENFHEYGLQRIFFLPSVVTIMRL